MSSLRLLTGERPEDVLRSDESSEIHRGQHTGEGAADEGAVDDHVHVGQAVPEDRYAGGRRDQGQQEHDHAAVPKDEDARQEDHRKQRDGVDEPLELQVRIVLTMVST
jgi:hypothetical protein